MFTKNMTTDELCIKLMYQAPVLLNSYRAFEQDSTYLHRVAKECQSLVDEYYRRLEIDDKWKHRPTFKKR